MVVHLLLVDREGGVVASSPGLSQYLRLSPSALAAGATAPDLAALALPADVVDRQLLDTGVTAHTLVVGGRDGRRDDSDGVAMLRETLDSVDASIVVYDREHCYRYGNKIYHETFPHLPPDEQLAGMPYREVLRLSVAARSIGDPQAYSDPEAFIDRRDRETRVEGDVSREDYTPRLDRWWQVRATRTPSGARVSLRVDITETKRLQQNLLRAQRLEIIGKLSGSVAHDFNNLLTVIMGSLEMIQLKAAQPAEVIALADHALTAAEGGARLTHELLTFVRRELAHLREIDPVAALAGMEDLLRRAIGQNISVTLGPHAAAGHVRVDVLQYEAALLNLALNARQAIEAKAATPSSGAPLGEVGFRIEEATLEDGGRAVAIVVTDTGSGMAPDIAAQAFEPFFTTSRNAAAPGLGLSQVQGFATAAGGLATLASRPGTGTAVTLLLPWHSPPAGVAAPPDAAPPPADGHVILVVEDDPAVLATTLDRLGGLGHRLLAATSPLVALDLLAGPEAIDLLFTDIVMPGGMNGVLLADAACRLRPGLKVLLATGYSAESLAAADAARFEVLRKPYRLSELASRLARLLAGPVSLSP